MYKTTRLVPWLSRSNENNFNAVQMAPYLPPNAQEMFPGLAIEKMMGMVKWTLAWSRKGGR